MVTPTPGGEVNDPVLAAAALAGVDRIFRVGGAQAVGALAFGTATVPGVDKIVGPGNAYVAAAKRRVFGRVGIDMVAGPSEVLVIADCERQRRLGRHGPLLAGRARRDRAGDPAHARRGVDRRASRRRCARQLAAHAAARDHRGLARRARRADPRARPRRGLRDRQPHRAGAPRARRGRSRRRCCRRSATRARSSSGHYASRVAGRLLRRSQPRAADVAHRALLLAAGRLRLPEALERDPASRAGARSASAASPPRSRAPKASRRTRAARSGASRTASEQGAAELVRDGDPRDAAPTTSPPAAGPGEARRDGESLSLARRSSPARWARASRASRSTAIPIRRTPPLKRRLREAMAIPDELEIVLGNGSDEILQMIDGGARAAGRHGALARALVRRCTA